MLRAAVGAAFAAVRRAEAVQQPVLQAARCMATAASTSKGSSAEVKLPTAPLQLSGTSAGIATLTWQCAAKEGITAKVQEEIHQMAECIETMPQLRRLATDPLVPAIVRKAIVQKVLEGSQISPIARELFVSLAEENILAATFDIAKAFDELQLAHKKETYVTIITAEKLDKLERTELRKQAEAFVEPGFKLVVQEKVDKKLLGGFILEFEDRLVDLSKAKKMEEFTNLVTKLEADLK